MLREIAHVRQIEGEPKRRWFTNTYFDLMVWFEKNDSITGFQLSYDKPGYERALTWDTKTGYSHDGIDQGEDKIGRKKTPIIVKDGIFEHVRITEKFRESCKEIENRISEFVIERIIRYPEQL